MKRVLTSLTVGLILGGSEAGTSDTVLPARTGKRGRSQAWPWTAMTHKVALCRIHGARSSAR
jgi:hypothetical protein